jgi:hypothetical protein
MTTLEFRKRHPKIYKQVLRRGFEAEKVRAMLEDFGADDPIARASYGDKKHDHLLPVERQLLA